LSPEIRKTLELEIGGLLLDMKSVIAIDEKTRKLLDKVSEGDFVLSNDMNETDTDGSVVSITQS
jgi:hypothetical protein